MYMYIITYFRYMKKRISLQYSKDHNIEYKGPQTVTPAVMKGFDTATKEMKSFLDTILVVYTRDPLLN